MWVSAFFISDGNPVTGLSPLIRIRDISDNNLVVTDVVMDEIGDGSYKYDFDTFNMDSDYVIRCDGGPTLSGVARYTFGSSGEYNTTFSGIQDDLDNPDQYKADVSGLPVVGEYDVTLSGIQADLDNPDQYKANISMLALENTVTQYNNYKADVSSLALEGTVNQYDNYKADVSNLALESTVSGLENQLNNVQERTDRIPNIPAFAGEYDVKLTSLQTNITFLKDIEGGKWELVNNQMIFYRSDNVTVVATFNLFDASGSPTMQNVYKRVRI